MKENYACKLTDLKVVLGADQRKLLHTTSSTTCVDVDDEDVVKIKVKQVKDDDTKEISLEGTVISIDMASLTVIHTCTRCSASVEIDSGFYCCSSCNMMGTMESITATKPKIGFCFKDVQNNKHNLEADASLLETFTGHTVLNQVKLAMHLCKMPPFVIKVANNVVISMGITDIVNGVSMDD